MSANFWYGKKVMITGHTGFKGSWLTLYLQSLGAKIVGYSLTAPTNPSLFSIAQVDKDICSYINDIRDYDSLHRAIDAEKPEVVFHLAAQSLVRYSYNNPVETYATNVMGTVHLLEALRQVECARVAIIVTSDKCYDNREWIWGYRENDPMGGYDPYSSSKGCAELVTTAYRNSFFNTENTLLLASTRAGNVVGAGDWANDRLIPDFMRAIVNKQSIKIRNPKAIRPWQHVLDPLSGYLALAESLWTGGREFTGGWNFGPNDDDSKSVEWIINRLATLWGDGACQLVIDSNQHVHEATFLKLDISKAKLKLNWQPKWSLEMALQHIVDWNKAYQKNSNMKKFTLKQIEEYQKSNFLN